MDRKSAGIIKGNGKKIVVGMSGGVDSTAALILLKKNGWNPVGLSLKLPLWEKGSHSKENPKSTTNSIKKAKEICDKYGCEHYILDVSRDFEKNVVTYFIESLKNSQTPNPCMVCNLNTKFFHLIKFADSKQIKYISPGHYARVTKSKKYKSYFLKTLTYNTQDQTYYLSLLSQKYLERTIFPLGEFTKKEVYKIVEKDGIEYFKNESQSQDFCYIPDKSMGEFLKKEIKEESGKIFDTKGNYLGKHKGLHNYTIGQRKKIGLAGGPYYVIKKDFEENALTISTNKNDLGKTEILLSDIFFSSECFYGKKLKVKAKIRYQQKISSAILFSDKDPKKQAKIIFDKPQIAVTPGQYCVFYVKNLCIGSGVISQ